ncbi:STAS domain-containing protein [Hoyosella subflava]|uniref:Uncharacterized protein n=1 Tax=Hoyosella subflava (strain DSM 45089 / JCM 17490 / NBRC 109087 / DQS3-9A1) TaxID=443218 RepID=F6EM75_HOYSD|nr:hypothetical protein [Hoyosella subflava]AEF39281.1 hypothetical protein AS9A_0829 [Hoyosella subflava DQS3-9A1]
MNAIEPVTNEDLDLSIERRADESILLELSGTLDALSLPRLFNTFALIGGTDQLFIDMRRIHFCSISAVRALTELNRRSAFRNTSVTVIAGEHLRDMFALTSRRSPITVRHDLPEAAESPNASRRRLALIAQ